MSEINATYKGDELALNVFAFYQSFDKELMSQPNEEFYSMVDEFYQQALK